MSKKKENQEIGDDELDRLIENVVFDASEPTEEDRKIAERALDGALKQHSELQANSGQVKPDIIHDNANERDQTTQRDDTGRS